MESLAVPPVYNSRRNIHLAPSTMNPLKILRKFAWIALLSVLVGAVLPGLVAFHEEVFYRDQTEQRVRSRKADAENALEEFNKERTRINIEISVLDGKISVASPADNALQHLSAFRQQTSFNFRKNPPSPSNPFTSMSSCTSGLSCTVGSRLSFSSFGLAGHSVP